MGLRALFAVCQGNDPSIYPAEDLPLALTEHCFFRTSFALAPSLASCRRFSSNCFFSCASFAARHSSTCQTNNICLSIHYQGMLVSYFVYLFCICEPRSQCTVGRSTPSGSTPVGLVISATAVAQASFLPLHTLVPGQYADSDSRANRAER